jgi:RNA polymerase sigma-70 factor (ECF subfamily)
MIATDSFSQIYTTYKPKVRKALLRFVDSSEVDDLTQEVFIKVEQALKGYRGESSLPTWIMRIATNTAIDRLRSPSHRHIACESMSLDDDSGELLACAGPDAAPDWKVFSQERSRCFMFFLDQLPAAFRKVFVLSELEGLSNAQIAHDLGISLASVKIRLHRGKERLFSQIRARFRAEDWR